MCLLHSFKLYLNSNTVEKVWEIKWLISQKAVKKKKKLRLLWSVWRIIYLLLIWSKFDLWSAESKIGGGMC